VNQNVDVFQKGSNPSQLAISLSHFYAYKQISEKYDHGLIFEDDVVLSKNFIIRFKQYLSQLPSHYDMLFIGDGCNLHIQPHKLVPRQFIYEKGLYPTTWGGDGAGRCTDSYLVSKKCATQLCDYIDHLPYKISQNIDWWLNVAARDNQFSIYWSEPTIVTQGTQSGLFNSSH
jgi:GR25 family glycosyltransferase involved in LPS biosynthesis